MAPLQEQGDYLAKVVSRCRRRAAVITIMFALLAHLAAVVIADSFTDSITPIQGYQLNFTTTASQITVTITARTTGWVGFGLAEAGGMIGADIMMAHVDECATGARTRRTFAPHTPRPPATLASSVSTHAPRTHRFSLGAASRVLASSETTGRRPMQRLWRT